MATLVLGAVGSAFFGPVGGFIGAAVGGYIDSAYIMPWLFPIDPLQGPRLNDLQVTTASEGSPMKWVIGPRNRVGGTVIWMPPIREEQTSSGGGKGGSTGPETIGYNYFADVAIGVCDTWDLPDGKIKKIKKVWADSKVIYENDTVTNQYTSITFYLGDQTAPDPIIEAEQGAGNVPNYTGTAYVVIEGLALAEFGNRCPNFTFLVEQDDDVSLGEAIGLVLARGQFDVAEYSVDRLSQCFYGMIATGPQTLATIINPLLLAYGVACQNDNGVFTFFPRGAERVVQIDTDDLSARERGTDAISLVQITDKVTFERPLQCTVRFVSTDNDLQQGSQTYSRNNFGTLTDTVIDFPITMTPDMALAIAKRMIWTAEVESQSVALDLPPKYVGIMESDRLEFTHEGIFYQVYVLSLSRGFNSQLKVEGVRIQPHTYNYTATAAGFGGTTGSAYTPPETFSAIMDCAGLNEATLTTIGIYTAVCAEDSTARWIGSSIYTSLDATTYTLGTSQSFEATMGTCVSSLPDGPVEVIDTRSTMLIVLKQGTLNTCTEDEMIGGTNRLAVQTAQGDWEIVGFQTATLIDTLTYEVSNLLRGRRGTEHLTHRHIAGAKVVLLESSSLGFLPRPASRLGVAEYYKAPAVRGVLDNYEPTLISPFKSRNVMPFSPCHIECEYDGDDFVFTWTRRSKSFMRLFGPAGAPYSSDESDRYIIEMLVGPGEDALVLRTTVVDGNTWTYTSAMQTEDGATPGYSDANIKIYQVSNIVGRGVFAMASFEAP